MDRSQAVTPAVTDWTPETGAQPVHGAIRGRWAQIGFEQSSLGYPIAEEVVFPEEGRVAAFQHGAIYWWPDTGAIELKGVVLSYTGLMCFGETDSDQGSDSDEAYVILGAVTPGGGITIRSQIYEDVDAGESRSDWLEIYRGVPGGLTLSTLLMEHDEGDPDKYETAMKAAVASAFTVVGALLTLIPVVGPVIATVAEPLLNAVAPTVGAELSNLNTGDDQLGQVTLALSAKQMVVLAARAPVSTFNGIAYKLETPLLSADGASYKAYFNLTLA